MDRRLLIGIVMIIVIGVGVVGYNFMTKPTPTDQGPEDNGEETSPEPGEGGEEPMTEPGENVTEPSEPVTGKATIKGVVSDAKSGDSLEAATVSVDGESTTTAQDGSFEVSVEKGSYFIEVSKEGYKKVVSSVSASEEKTYTVDFTLNPLETEDTKGILKIITRHGADIQIAAEREFLKTEYASTYGIEDVRWVPVSPTLWTDTITRTGDIDLGWGGGPVLFDIIRGEGLLAPLTSDGIQATLAEIPYEMGGVPTRRVVDGEVYWTGSAVASFGFTINKRYLEDWGLPEPTKWSDLANETYAVTLPYWSVGTADATLSTSNTRMFAIILQTHGWQDGWNILIRMGANARIYDRSESVRDAAIEGTIGVGTTIDFYGYTAQLKNPELCKYILPADGTIVNADPIAMLTTTTKPGAAQAFIAWLLSPEGQKIWLDENINRLPMNPAVFDTPEGLARADLKEIYEATNNALIIDFSDDLALSYESSMMYFYHAAIARAQIKLEEAWEDMTWALENGDITRAQFMELVGKLGDPHEFVFTDPDTGATETFTQEYAQSISGKISSDAEFKTRMVDEWRAVAEAHYDSVKAELESLTG